MAGSASNHVPNTPRGGSRDDPSSAVDLLPLVYAELRELAASRMAREPAGGAEYTLQATGLVHEAYLRLVAGGTVHWNSRGHFFGAAALAMRRILVERARRCDSVKHGGPGRRVTLVDAAVEDETGAVDLIALDEALTALEAEDKRRGDVVMLRYFAGLTIDDTADALGVSAATVKRDWDYARAWLYDRMGGA